MREELSLSTWGFHQLVLAAMRILSDFRRSFRKIVRNLSSEEPVMKRVMSFSTSTKTKYNKVHQLQLRKSKSMKMENFELSNSVKTIDELPDNSSNATATSGASIPAEKTPAANVSLPRQPEEVHYFPIPGEQIEGRYRILCEIGSGAYGRVYKAFDDHAGEPVAVKIIKNGSRFFSQAQIELSILKRIKEVDTEDSHHLVQLKDDFIIPGGHQALVFEILSLDLYSLLRKSSFRGLSVNTVRKFGRQLLESLDFLRSPGLQITHCDLKPENILLLNPHHTALKIIDFGSAVTPGCKMYKYIQSRYYRAPEVLMGLPYDFAIDVWSLGCLLVEMCTGSPLFDGRDEVDQMRKIVDILGMPPQEMISGSPKADKFFDNSRRRKSSSPLVYELNASSKSASSPRHRLVSIMDGRSDDSSRQLESAGSDQLLFLDLIMHMLEYDPAKRIAPSEALKHPFFESVMRTRSEVCDVLSSAVVDSEQHNRRALAKAA